MRLSKPQSKVLTAVITFIETNNYPPSARDLAANLGIASPSTIHGHLVRLRKKGYVDWEESKPRTLRVIRSA